MDLNDFQILTSDVRAEAVWVYGSFLAIRSEADHYVALYHMGSFFVEVWYSPVAGEIAHTNGFSSAAFLDPYLQMIDISEAVVA
ncbi:hypothetical protein DXT99_09795 [Pontibacter diazotrophicus]|uniref:Uncharacterized protein n=1 Tax=Pontibacter diazotrophicus TaxID=1400979 RepID=A0A3D8LDC1_9BACT|nr:hypothetical protein [Pontibacter diazotrophicus]RDV15343.1 hypothetical protein DXT99_09795 [Pontibacter diazotrophicus]